ncbi:MAG TPA: DNA-formamidopyrimidine glycosylase family protein [Acidimicrobiales bacterium]|nr:DNA-formamidopyrimidine glycosylase family protein [Acidimicrobiales bacterium]
MPEGDTLYRTAATLQRWLGGREVTEATSAVPGVPVDRLVGQRVAWAEAWGKHLLLRFGSGQVLHTHLRMSGSWHVYSAGDRWRRPAHQARLVLVCGDRVAVCFNAPVVELLAAKAEQVHPALARLGPDVLGEPFELDEVRRRARARPSDLPVGELLLDQRAIAGIGNIWRNEALFLEGRHPRTPQGALSDGELDRVVTTARRLMRESAGIDPSGTAGGRPAPRWVYRRTGRPCRRCGTPIQSALQGEQARRVYWCPTCQPAPEASG